MLTARAAERKENVPICNVIRIPAFHLGYGARQVGRFPASPPEVLEEDEEVVEVLGFVLGFVRGPNPGSIRTPPSLPPGPQG